MKYEDFKKMLSGASESTRRLNRDVEADHTSGPGKPKRVDGLRVEEAPARPRLDAGYKLVHVDVDFWASHGKRLDLGDNIKFVPKPILDAMVNLGFASDDREIKTDVTQRLHCTDLNIRKV